MECLDVDIVDEQFTGARIDQSEENLKQRRLAGARPSDDSNFLRRSDFQIDIFQSQREMFSTISNGNRKLNKQTNQLTENSNSI